MLPRPLFSEEHDIFRESVRRFIEKEIEPYHDQWEKDGIVSREVWLKAGEAGLLGCSVPEEYGGAGGDFLHTVVVGEEMARAEATGPAFHLHSEIVMPYIFHYGTEEQKREWLPRMVRGEVIGAIAMTEPHAGSDLQAIRTTALKDGNEWLINGQKVFITNGTISDLIVVACKTDPTAGAKGTSLVLVEGDREGFERGRNLDKLGWKAQDTSELFFNDVRVPMTNLLGEKGRGFIQLVQQLPQERLLVALRAVATMEAALERTVDYVKERKAFGKTIMDFQNTKFKLAEVKTQVTVARVFVDRFIEMHLEADLTADDAAMAKLHCTELQSKVLDECLQLFGGYGYMWEFPIARAYAGSRVMRIAGGSSEVMKEIISRTL